MSKSSAATPWLILGAIVVVPWALFALALWRINKGMSGQWTPQSMTGQ